MAAEIEELAADLAKCKQKMDEWIAWQKANHPDVKIVPKKTRTNGVWVPLNSDWRLSLCVPDECPGCFEVALYPADPIDQINAPPPPCFADNDMRRFDTNEEVIDVIRLAIRQCNPPQRQARAFHTEYGFYATPEGKEAFRKALLATRNNLSALPQPSNGNDTFTENAASANPPAPSAPDATGVDADQKNQQQRTWSVKGDTYYEFYRTQEGRERFFRQIIAIEAEVKKALATTEPGTTVTGTITCAPPNLTSEFVLTPPNAPPFTITTSSPLK
jgi:hypothetical protein